MAIACKSDNVIDKTAACLLPMQIAALRKVMGGPRPAMARRSIPIGHGTPGSARRRPGRDPGLAIWKMGGYASATNNGALLPWRAVNSAVFRSPPLDVADDVTSLTRYALNANIDEAYAAAHVKWGALNEAPVDFMHADATDLDPFTRRGGKIILFHGVSDPVFSILDTMRWLDAVNKREKGRRALRAILSRAGDEPWARRSGDGSVRHLLAIGGVARKGREARRDHRHRRGRHAMAGTRTPALPLSRAAPSQGSRQRRRAGKGRRLYLPVSAQPDRNCERI
jgi:hypothetical protein